MNHHPFTVSLNPFVQVTTTEDYCTLHSVESDPTALFTLATTPGIGMALNHLKAGNITPESLVQGLIELDGQATGEQFGRMLQQLDERGWLSYAVLPLAVAVPMVESAQLNLTEPYWTQTYVTLSRFAYQHPYEGTMVLESPLSKFRVKLLEWRASAILAQLAQPQSLATLTPPPYLGAETAYQFLNLLWSTGFLTSDPEPPSLQLWDFHNLLFHSRSCNGRHNYIETSRVESIEFDESEKLTEATFSGSEAELRRVEAESESIDTEILVNQFESVGLVAEIASDELGESGVNTSVKVESTELEAVDLMADHAIAQTPDTSIVAEGESELATVSASEIESSAIKQSVALHPHDLDDRIPGLAELHNQTLGDPRITIVILDGDPDHTLSCFEGAEVSKVFPYWHEPADAITAEDYITFQAIRDQGLKGQEKEDALKAALRENKERVELNDHACHVTSTIVGQEHSPVFGIAPNCRVINIPQDALVVGNYDDVLSPLNLARGFELALELGANIIHCGFCRPTQTGEGEEMLVQAIKKCQENNVLIVSPTGNNLGECWCMPAVLSGTLAVGSAKVDGTPCHFSNWGGNNAKEGILAPGEDVLGAQPYTEKPVRLTGTSMAAPVMTGISALLMSLQLQQGKPVDAEAVRTALLNTAIPCNPEVVEEPERCLRGFVNIPGAMKVLFGQPSVTISFAGDQVIRTEHAGYAMPTATVTPASITPTVANPVVQLAVLTTSNETSVTAAAIPADTNTVEASAAYSGNVYALGTIGYDFGDETRRDTFQQTMFAPEVNGVIVPPDPYDPRQMVEHLDRHPDDSRSLIWTLSLDGDIIYALEPTGAFSSQIYEMFLLMLAGQLEPESSNDFVERVSIPAKLTNRTVELFSGQVLPVVKVHNVRGMYGWKVNTLVDAAMAAIARRVDEAQAPLVRQALSNFLHRVYNDLRNIGNTSRDRALNFAATNIFQAAATFAQAIAQGRQLDIITVEKSPFCRLNSDCWDIRLEFSDPESSRRGRKVFCFTIDVALIMPVTIGEIKSWSLPSRSKES
ncbi:MULTISPECIES: PatA/PatG family cyanobactin maturation protease [unclassified Tolypothrix]|nr:MULTISPECIES: PatA/PatG family cyanobactin maturation protease [unclassified Tolypothrix]BAY89764.1 putative peptidase [Microchaete diplosiphon NIES-3275]EKF00816.1 S8A subfamily subtilase [Tolypothrix sp. PCC 7601]MBE9083472.1 PatA/PatG family cyanobactin maturation protease [Tolypothrix sp. LEGE 11397]UYD24022.1 PatA/PatG family cyanobactin maturation protease [Tolypothrix sp. PCC 7712]UYD33748.1 PatA/PatG family cyanobactin maturation protease [Tolypothrix sp. PCC 7601]